MKIQSVSNDNTFKAKTIPTALRRDIACLRTRMDADAVILQTQERKQVVRIRSLDINGEAKFKDGRFLARKDKNKKFVPYGADTAMIEFGKVKFITDSNGNIIFHKKPFFVTWKNIFEKAALYIKTALDNYKDNQIVVKQVNKQESLTPEGKKQLEKEYQKVMDVFNKLNPFKEQPKE